MALTFYLDKKIMFTYTDGLNHLDIIIIGIVILIILTNLSTYIK